MRRDGLRTTTSPPAGAVASHTAPASIYVFPAGANMWNESSKRIHPVKHKCKAKKCARAARWALTATDDDSLPELLCRHHWNQLRTTTPIKALNYGPIALRPGGILNRYAVVNQKDHSTTSPQFHSLE